MRGQGRGEGRGRQERMGAAKGWGVLPAEGPLVLPQADIIATEEGLYSERYGDHYASRQGAVDEARYLFVEGNDLPRRFAKRLGDFTALELGFGTGLNFRLVAECWLGQTQEGCLTYAGVEAHPIAYRDLPGLRDAQGISLSDLDRGLMANAPPPHRGFHLLRLVPGRLNLLLLYGEATEVLPQCGPDSVVDVFLLDGFKPSANQAMWSTEVFAQLARLARAGATLSTYSTAGAVRRGLDEAGFKVDKAPGFGRKRESLRARASEKKDAPEGRRAGPKHVAVVGAGLAGASVAQRLAERGLQVSVVDEASEPAAGGSGNPWLVCRPHLSAGWDPLSELTCMGYPSEDEVLAGEYRLQGFAVAAGGGKHTGRHGKIEMRYAGSPWLMDWPDRLGAGATIEEGYVLRPARLVDGSAWVREALRHPAISTIYGARVQGLRELSGAWGLDLAGKREARLEVDAVVIASGCGAAALPTVEPWLDGAPVAGSVGAFSSQEPTLEARGWALSQKSYRASLDEGRVVVGATRYPGKSALPHSAEEELERLCEEALRVGGIGVSAQGRIWSGPRWKTPDHLPLVGPVPDRPERFAPLGQGKKVELGYRPGLFMSVGHGSKGSTTAPAAADALVADILGGMDSLPAWVRRAVAVERFVARAYRQNGGGG